MGKRKESAEEILDKFRKLLVVRIRVKKQNLLLYLAQVLQELEVVKGNVENSLGDPTSSAGVNPNGIIRHSARMESYVGQIVALCETYKEIG